MGTQQILLIILSVIIVGIAVVVGLTMFNSQAKNANQQACIAEMTGFSASAAAYWRTPASQGGAGHGSSNWNASRVISYIGYPNSTSSRITTENGRYTFSVSNNTLTIRAVGTEPNVDPVLTKNMANNSQPTITP